MMRRGIGRRPSLVGTAARTAVVVGTASAVAGNSAQKRSASAEQAAKAQAYDDAAMQKSIDEAAARAVAQAQPAAPAPMAPPVAAAPAEGPSVLDQLKELAALKDAGILDDAEFAAAKAKILTS
jgi:Short C-terminal domain